MKKIRLNLGKRSYDILVEAGAVSRLPATIKSLEFKGPIVVIADKTVLSRAKTLIKPAFEKVPNEQCWIEVPGIEKSKSIKVYERIIHEISNRTKMHRPLIIALGGGVVGDLAGFVAATYRRGVECIQIPTTLLAQVDSAIGGKVGVDLPQAKNLIGAFKQPRAVLIDTNFLKTLPIKQLHNGLAEIIKYGVIESRSLFSFLEKNTGKILSLDKKVLEKVVHECAVIKARIVEKDELDDKNVRIILNFGHTLGHAVEAAAGYIRAYSHGESIAIGMLLAGEIALKLDMFSEKDLARMTKLIKSTGLPVKARHIPFKKIMDSFTHDKKFISGTNRLILPKKIGLVEIIEDIPEILIKNVLKSYAG